MNVSCKNKEITDLALMVASATFVTPRPQWKFQPTTWKELPLEGVIVVNL
tara:strand:- start:167 stop:316 length:150 start_codon:yes stop_codon:yes gene_type:complete